MRKRLSWDEEKVAEITKTADPYTMNQDRKNPPVQKYQTGDPSSWAEDPNMATPWKTEGRTETGHPAPAHSAREAVVAVRKMEDKALKCITIAQRMLPNASDYVIEEQATDLMYMPEKCILATLQRQSDLAEILSGKKKEEEEVEAKKEEETTPPEEEKKAKKEKEEEEVEAVKKKEEETTPPEEEKKAKKEKEKEEVEAAKKKEEEATPPEEEKKEAGDLLDQIFMQELKEPVKTGAKKLSGLVKRASEDDRLNSLWDAPPDISKIFS